MTERGTLMKIRAVLEDFILAPRAQLDAVEAIVSEVLDDDVLEATAHAMRNPRAPGAAPHHTRCNAMSQGMRCRVAEGHGGDHRFEDPRP